MKKSTRYRWGPAAAFQPVEGDAGGAVRDPGSAPAFALKELG